MKTTLFRMIAIGAMAATLPLGAAVTAGAQEGTPRGGAVPQAVGPGAPQAGQFNRGGRNWNAGGRRWSGGHHWRHRRHGGWGTAAGFGAGFLLGNAIARPGPYAYYYEAEPVYRDADEIAYCSRRFKSYDPDSGTYLGYDGQRHPCP